jgi:hypothetical protein
LRVLAPAATVLSLFAQAPVDLDGAHRIERSLASGLEPLTGCEISRVDPALTYALHIQSGYAAEVSLAQFRGAGHQLSALVKLTSATGGVPSYFLRRHSLPDLPPNGGSAHLAGSFRVAEGAYEVTVTAFDEQWRSCVASWQIRARTEPPGADLSQPQVDRLTILLHAAPASPDRSSLEPDDVQQLTDALSSVLERLPARQVRLVAFNLEARKEMARVDDFGVPSLAGVTRLLEAYQPGPVHVRTLANAHGDLDLLVRLLNRELVESDPPAAILFLGPPGPQGDRLSIKDLRLDTKHMPRLFYIEFGGHAAYSPDAPAPEIMGAMRGRVSAGRVDQVVENTPDHAAQRRGESGMPRQGDSAANEFNTIRYTVSALKGKTFLVWRPEDLAKALQEIAAPKKR